ncbi:DMT family transporter [Komagataeibacter sp. AV436]|uniref:DMT family transporter n=1 Tax=Komagataeibacter melomenusus TaxID=2766578 RepID=A0ABX2AIH4_9PROT|nr:DMT family transporter [Komagataeibacter melomenusus]MBV1832175.1 DMT family transporter [Komagataeibacter melomenusus]NPC67930.1 DMT family transporter [Komagataeibacter melomenusus]
MPSPDPASPARRAAAVMGSPMVLALVCVLAWSLIAPVSKLELASVSFYNVLFISNLFSCVAVGGAFAVLCGGNFRRLSACRRSNQVAMLCGVLDGLFYLCLYHGYHIGNGVAVLIAQYSWPVMIVAISAIFPGVRPSLWQGLGLACGVAAMTVTLSRGDITHIGLGHPAALGLVMLGALCFAVLSVLSRLYVADALAGTVWLFVASTVVSVLAGWQAGALGMPPRAALPGLVLNGVAINGLSYVLWILALARGNAVRISALVFLTPVLSTLWLVLIFHEPFLGAYALGLVLALAAGLLCLRGRSGAA